MKATIQVKTTVEAALTAVRHMTLNGYQAVEVVRDSITDIHFMIDGQTSSDVSVTIFRDFGEDCESFAYVGFRPQ